MAGYLRLLLATRVEVILDDPEHLLHNHHASFLSLPVAVRNHNGMAFGFSPEPRSPSPE
jgi:hypothetical protein